MFAVLLNLLAVDKHVNHAGAVLMRFDECCVVLNPVRVEDVVTVISMTSVQRRSNKPQNAAKPCPSDQGISMTGILLKRMVAKGGIDR